MATYGSPPLQNPVAVFEQLFAASGGGGGGGGATKFVDLTDVSVAPTPATGQAIHYDGAKWTQASEMSVNPTTKQISLQTTGAVAIFGAGSVGVQSTGGELAIAAAGDASLLSSLGNVDITSLTNAVQIASALDTTITSATGDVKIKADDGKIEIVAPNDRIQVIGGGGVTIATTVAGQVVKLSADQGTIYLEGKNILTSEDSTVTIDLLATTVSKIQGATATEIGIDNGVSATNIRGDEINVVLSNSGVAFVPTEDVGSILMVVEDNKSAAQYSTDIATIPSAIPNVQFVLDNINADNTQDIRVGGQAPLSTTLVFGTTNTQDINIIKNNQSVLSTDATSTTLANNGIEILKASSLGAGLENSNATINAGYILVEQTGPIGYGQFQFETSGTWSAGTEAKFESRNLNCDVVGKTVNVISRDGLVISNTDSGTMDITSIGQMIINSGNTVNITGEGAYVTGQSVVRIDTGADGTIQIVPGANIGSIIEVSTDNKTAAQYAAEIVSLPPAIPNVEFVNQAIANIPPPANVILQGGNSFANDIIIGSNDAQGGLILKTNNQPRFVITSNAGVYAVVHDMNNLTDERVFGYPNSSEPQSRFVVSESTTDDIIAATAKRSYPGGLGTPLVWDDVSSKWIPRAMIVGIEGDPAIFASDGGQTQIITVGATSGNILISNDELAETMCVINGHLEIPSMFYPLSSTASLPRLAILTSTLDAAADDSPVLVHKEYVCNRFANRPLLAALPNAGDTIKYDGTNWVNSSLSRAMMYWTQNAVAENTGLPIATGIPRKLSAVATTPIFVKGFTHTSPNRLTWDGPSTALFDIDVCVASFAGDNDRSFEIYVSVNGVGTAVPQSRFTNNNKNATGANDSSSKSFLAELAPADIVEVWIVNLAGATEFICRELSCVVKEVL